MIHNNLKNVYKAFLSVYYLIGNIKLIITRRETMFQIAFIPHSMISAHLCGSENDVLLAIKNKTGASKIEFHPHTHECDCRTKEICASILIKHNVDHIILTNPVDMTFKEIMRKFSNSFAKGISAWSWDQDTDITKSCLFNKGL